MRTILGRPAIFEDQAQAMNFVLAPDETIYGVSDADGKFKHGTIFQLKTDGSGFVVLHDFYGGDDDGQSPTFVAPAALRWQPLQPPRERSSTTI